LECLVNMVKPPKIRFHTHFNKKSLSIKPLFCDFVDKLQQGADMPLAVLFFMIAPFLNRTD
ncbi:hypothetical protein RE440_19285, partial [Bacillus licheniformis]|uniref:hypothetical protein n=1 Tax=Bacillus licheniformis TaxID=1402 RepID=UPI00280D86F9